MATHKPINILEAFAAAPPPLDYVLPNMVASTVGALVSPGGAGKANAGTCHDISKLPHLFYKGCFCNFHF